MPIALEVSRGVRCGDLLFTCGQVDLDGSGRPQRPGDLRAQSERAMGHLLEVLARGGMSAADMVQLHVFYRDDGEVDLDAYRAHLRALIGPAAQPVLVLTPIPAFFYPGVEVEIDAIASRCRETRGLVEDPSAAFPAGVRAGEVVIAKASSERRRGGPGSPGLTTDAEVAIDRLAGVLGDLGSGLSELCKVTIYLTGGGQDRDTVEGLLAARLPGAAPVTTTVCLPELPRAEPRVSIEGFARAGPDGEAPLREPFHAAPAERRGVPRGLRCGDLLFIGGQLSLDDSGAVCHPGDLAGQTRQAMAGLRRTLSHFGADFGNLVKVNTYYLGGGTPEELHINLEIRSGCYVAPGPASTGMPVPRLHRPAAMISVDAIAALGSLAG